MHFVYKMDNLFRSIRVSDKNSSVTKGFHFLNLFELQTFCVLKMNHSKPYHQFSTLYDFICLHFFFACVLCLLRRNHGYSSSLNMVLGSALTLKGGIS